MPIPFVYLKGIDRCDGHNAGVIEEHIDTAETVDGLLDERLHFCALRHIGSKSDSLAAVRRDLLNHCVDSVRTPRSKYNFAPCSARSFAVLSPIPLLAPVITTTLPVIFDISILFSLFKFKNLLFPPSCTPLNDRPCDFRNLFDQ
jgi:hypothetical protein